MVGPVIGIQQKPPVDHDTNDTQPNAANSNGAATFGSAAGNFAAEALMGVHPPQGTQNNAITVAPGTNPVPANSNQPIPPTPTDTHAAVQSVTAADDRAVRASLIATAGKNPDQALEAQKLAASVGLPVDVAERNIDQIRTQAATDQASDHLVGNPSLTTQLANPAYAKVAADDVPNLGKIETGVQLSTTPVRFGAKGPAFTPPNTAFFDDGTKPTNSNNQAAMRNFVKGVGSAAAQVLRGIDELGTALSHPNNVSAYRRIIQGDSSYVWRIQENGDMPVIAIQDRKDGRRMGPATFYVQPGDDLYKFITNPDQQQAMLRAEEKKIDPSDHFLYKAGNHFDGYLKQHNVTTLEQDTGLWTGTIARVAGQVTAYGVTAAATGAVAGPLVGAGVTGVVAAATGADDSYQGAITHGKDHATALHAAEGDALVSALVSFLPGGKQVNLLAGKLAQPLTKIIGEKLTGVLAKGAANSVIGAAQATTQQLGTNIVAKSAFDPSRPWYEDLTRPSVPGAIGNLFLGLVPHAKGGGETISLSGADSIHPELAPVMQAATSAQAVSSMLAGARDSKLRLRDADLFAQTLDHMAAQHNAGPLQISAPALQNYLHRPDVDGLDLLHRMPSIQAQLPMAIATGKPVSVPIPEFVHALADSEPASLLALHVKPAADAPSLAEAVLGLKGLQQDAGDIGIPTANDPLTTEQNPAPHGLSNEDAARWAKDRTEYRDPLKVVAKSVVNNSHYLGTNPMARSQEAKDQNKASVVADHVAAKKRKYTVVFPPNGNMADAHAELEVIQKAYENNDTQGQDMVMTVLGKKVCRHCTDDIPLAAERAGLKSLTIENVDEDGRRRIYYWEPGTKLKQVRRQ